jgi:hypothetical protein|tara:strand:+ start:1652 stop:1987 length:336 start_codon:yes stop_codon:yes gene_type:complete
MNRETNTDINIDSLFAELRNTEPCMQDQGFSTRIIAELEQKAELSFFKDALITMLFTLLGCLLTYAFFPVAELMALLPSSIHINPMSLLTLGGSVALACCAACWTLDTDRI